ncbi:hypothetical protein AGDE_03110 [Angomonas deanei]|nr:hypothetical protein AGDE_05138 [Angomonas deanei]EPY40816.1 hypothetical protein AGDE_03110 [Angomonas deanei]|eukprot:EPY38791.1 hypothetical protein AGDE_05138 [Angomonas deanei]
MIRRATTLHNTSSSMSIAVRKAVRADIPTMVDMQIAMAKETENLDLDRAVLTRGMTIPFEKPNVADYYVAYDTDPTRVVGMLMTTQEWSDWRAASILWIQSVFIAKDYRRKGVYTAMYQYLKKMVEDSEYYGGIRLYVETENKRAQGTYTKMGMEKEHYYMMKWMKSHF